MPAHSIREAKVSGIGEPALAEQFDLVAVGNAIVDIMCKCDDAFLARIGIPKGHMVIVRSPGAIARIATKLTGRFEVSGGSAANVAVGIASLGGRAAFVGRVAEDEHGRIFRRQIRQIGVTFETLPVTGADSETAHSLILVTPDGKRTMLTYLGCSADLHIGPTAVKSIRNARVVYLEGYLYDSPNSKAAAENAARLAKASGKLLSFCVPDAFCVNRHRADFLNLIRSNIDVLFANEEEILSLYQTDRFEDAVRHVSRDTNLAILTLGDRGSIIVSKGVPVPMPAETQRKVIDATGAGDMFAAGFLFAMLRGAEFQQAARMGSFAAAEIISFMGARPEVRLSHLARLRGLAEEVVA